MSKELITQLFEEAQDNPDSLEWKAADALESQAREIESLRIVKLEHEQFGAELDSMKADRDDCLALAKLNWSKADGLRAEIEHWKYQADVEGHVRVSLGKERDDLRAELQLAWNTCGDAETKRDQLRTALVEATKLIESLRYRSLSDEPIDTVLTRCKEALGNV